jgi:hypothetical protein
MNASLRDPHLLELLRPLDIRRYLEATGWHRSGTAPHSASLWTLRRGRSEYEVLLPVDPQLRDYALRMGELLHTLQAAEDRPVPEIWGDLTLAGFDVVRVRVQPRDGGAGSIILDEGISLVQSTREMLLAAACAAVEPRRAYPTRKPGKAAEFIQRVRLAAPENGSFVVTALTPVPPSLGPAPGGQERLDVADPYEREVSLTLSRSLAALRQAAEAGSADAFNEAVRQGVSANLCSAVAEMDTAATEGVEVSLSWARTRPTPLQAPNRILLPAAAIPVIREAGRVFKETTPVDEFELTGAVIRLDRPESSRVGVVTVLGFVEGTPRRVTVELEPDEYDVAIRAHQERLPVRCSGVLRRTATTFALEAPHGFEVAEVS